MEVKAGQCLSCCCVTVHLPSRLQLTFLPLGFCYKPGRGAQVKEISIVCRAAYLLTPHNVAGHLLPCLIRTGKSLAKHDGRVVESARESDIWALNTCGGKVKTCISKAIILQVVEFDSVVKAKALIHLIPGLFFLLTKQPFSCGSREF